MKQLHWFWCWLCYRAYLALPLPMTHRSLYGKFSLWILGYAGFYEPGNCKWATRLEQSRNRRPRKEWKRPQVLEQIEG